MYRDDFPELAQLLGGYFHQDFLEEFSSADNAIREYLRREPAENAKRACSELDAFIRLIEVDPNPTDALFSMGCYYDCTADGWTVVNWLQHVRDRLSAAGSGRSP